MAITRYDVESFLVDLEAFLKEKLNTKITEINTEKNDTITLKPVADEAYFFQTFNDRATNYNPVLFYGVSQVQTTGSGPVVSKAYTVDVAIIFADHGDDLNTAKRLFRYHRALEELFTTYWANLKNSVKIKVQSLNPVALTLPNSSEEYRAIGVSLDFTLAG